MLKRFSKLQKLMVLFQEKEIALRMILISFIRITDTERDITHKYKASCWKKYRVHWCSGDFGIRTRTKARVAKNLHDFLQVV